MIWVSALAIGCVFLLGLWVNVLTRAVASLVLKQNNTGKALATQAEVNEGLYKLSVNYSQRLALLEKSPRVDLSKTGAKA